MPSIISGPSASHVLFLQILIKNRVAIPTLPRMKPRHRKDKSFIKNLIVMCKLSLLLKGNS